MSLFEVKVFVVCRFGLGFLVYIFTLLVFKFMAHEGAAHVLRGVFQVYHQLILGLAIANDGIGGPVVNSAPGAARHNIGYYRCCWLGPRDCPLSGPRDKGSQYV